MSIVVPICSVEVSIEVPKFCSLNYQLQKIMFNNLFHLCIGNSELFSYRNVLLLFYFQL